MYRLERPISTLPSLARVYVEQHPDLQKDHLLASRDPDLQNIHSWHNCQDQDETHLFLTLNVLDILCVLSVTKPILFYSGSGSNPYYLGENLEIIIKNTLQLNKTEESTIPNSPTVRKVQNSKA